MVAEAVVRLLTTLVVLFAVVEVELEAEAAVAALKVVCYG